MLENEIISFDTSALAVFLQGGPIGFSISLLLIVLSFLTWIVIFAKWMKLSSLESKTEDFIKRFWESKSLTEFNNKVRDMDDIPAKEIFRSGFNEMVRVIQEDEKKGEGVDCKNYVQFDTVKRSLLRQKIVEETKLGSRMSILAISASAAPFIGLLGTVIGIIRAFHDIGVAGSSSLATVAPGISEALMTTALGLFAAIPAVIFYNLLSTKIRRHLVLLDSFSADFLNLLQRHYSTNK